MRAVEVSSASSRRFLSPLTVTLFALVNAKKLGSWNGIVFLTRPSLTTRRWLNGGPLSKIGARRIRERR